MQITVSNIEKIVGAALILVGLLRFIEVASLIDFLIGVILLLSGISILLFTSRGEYERKLAIILYRVAALLTAVLVGVVVFS